MGKNVLSRIMANLGLGVIHEIPFEQKIEEDHNDSEEGKQKRWNVFTKLDPIGWIQYLT